MPQQVSATIRVPGEVYAQLITIAEARDCTISESFNIYLERIRKEAREEAREEVLENMPEPKPEPKPKRKSKGGQRTDLRQSLAKVEIAEDVVAGKDKSITYDELYRDGGWCLRCKEFCAVRPGEAAHHAKAKHHLTLS